MSSRPVKFALLLLCGLPSACNRKLPPAQPSARTHSVTLKWAPSTSRVAGYRIYRSSARDVPPGLLAVAAPNATEYLDKSVEAGKTYYYYVKSFDAQGRESQAAEISATVPPDPPQ